MRGLVERSELAWLPLTTSERCQLQLRQVLYNHVVPTFRCRKKRKGELAHGFTTIRRRRRERHCRRAIVANSSTAIIIAVADYLRLSLSCYWKIASLIATNRQLFFFTHLDTIMNASPSRKNWNIGTAAATWNEGPLYEENARSKAGSHADRPRKRVASSRRVSASDLS